MIELMLELNFFVLCDRVVSQDQTARQGQYHVQSVPLVMIVPHQEVSHCVLLETILIMEKEYVAHVPVVKCAQIHHSNLRYISQC